MAEFEYTLAEIIEGPKRINSIPCDKLLDFVLESTETQDRFEALMDGLCNNAIWSIFGLGIMASDMINFNKIFEEELTEVAEVKYHRGGINLFSVFKLVMSYFDKQLIYEKKHRQYLVRYMAETLADDEHRFAIACISQKYKKELFECFKKMFEHHGNLPSIIRELFSFTIDHSSEKSSEFTPFSLPISSYTVYKKIGNMLYTLDDVCVEKRTAQSIIKVLGKAQIPSVCELYCTDDIPFMIMSCKSSVLLRKPKPFDDYEFIKMFYDGCNGFVCTNEKGIVVSFITTNNFIEEETFTCKTVKKVQMPFAVSKKVVTILFCKNETGKQLVSFAPSDVDLKSVTNGSDQVFVKYNDTYYLKRT